MNQQKCPKCRTTDFANCHSMHCPMRNQEHMAIELSEITEGKDIVITTTMNNSQESFLITYINKDSNDHGKTFLIREIPDQEHHYFIVDGKSNVGGGRLLKKYCHRINNSQEQKSAEEFFREIFKPDIATQQNWNSDFKHFNTYNMIEFAHKYAQQQLAEVQKENEELKQEIEQWRESLPHKVNRSLKEEIAALKDTLKRQQQMDNDVEEENNMLEEGLENLHKVNTVMKEALTKISNWELPETNQKWDDGSPVSYEAAYGTNGSRDYFKNLAMNALTQKDEEAN